MDSATPKISILVVGDELLSGAVIDTNTTFLASELRKLGGVLERVVMVGDEIAEISSALNELSKKSELILVTGGLGPTTDDVTRNGIADFVAKPLELNSDSLTRIKERFKSRNRPFSENNARQAYFPEGATVYQNPVGTADWFITSYKDNLKIVSLPGVPRELHAIYREQLHAQLLQLYPKLRPLSSGTLKIFGLSESYIGSVVESLELPATIRVGYRPVFPEVWLTFTALGDPAELETAMLKVRERLGDDYVFSKNPEESFAASLGKIFMERGLTLSVAESCTGGIIADSVISTPGASNYFLSSLVTYSDEAKEVFVGVRSAFLADFGAVSAEVAIEMARGARLRIGAHYGVAVTGVAGPDGGSADKPVGTVYIGLARDGGEEAFRFDILYERNAFRRYCATLALDLVRRDVLGYTLTPERK